MVSKVNIWDREMAYPAKGIKIKHHATSAYDKGKLRGNKQARTSLHKEVWTISVGASKPHGKQMYLR